MKIKRGTLLGVGLIGAAVIMVVLLAAIRADLRGIFYKPGAPQPSASDAARMSLSAEGVRLTIKQRSSAWLPGGKIKLHLDDITGGQVLVSATDPDGQVIFGPQSAQPGNRFTIVPAGHMPIELEVLRLKNLLGGDDFGEFLARRGSP